MSNAMTRYLRWRLSVSMLLAAMALGMGATRAGAAESTAGSDWKFTTDIYLYGAGVGGETKSGGDVDIGFDTLIKDLKMGFMGGFGARKGKWSLMADVIYLDVSQDNSGQLTLPGSINVATSSTVELKGWIVTPYVGYNLIDAEKGSLDVIGGRGISISTPVSIWRPIPLGPGASRAWHPVSWTPICPICWHGPAT